jgi:hypothetical protein
LCDARGVICHAVCCGRCTVGRRWVTGHQAAGTYTQRPRLYLQLGVSIASECAPPPPSHCPLPHCSPLRKAPSAKVDCPNTADRKISLLFIDSTVQMVVLGLRNLIANTECSTVQMVVLGLQKLKAKTVNVVLRWAATENFRSPCFSLGAAVLDPEFRADHESGLRIEQSPAIADSSTVLNRRL